MTPIKTNLCNFTYTAPAGMTAEQCGDLHCMRNPENHTITSFWKPEPEEASAIASGGLVMLTIHGLAHPPVAMGACHNEISENAPPRTLSDIGRTAHEINARNGWDTFTMGLFPASPEPGLIGETNENQKVRFLCTHMALVHTEVSEATEAIRHRDRENFDEELADIIIRVTSIAHGLGTDLEAAVAAKLEKNKSRGFKHGGKAT